MEDDHLPFVQRGVPSADVIDLDYGPQNSYHHTAQDTMDKISAKSLTIAGNVFLETIRLLNQHCQRDDSRAHRSAYWITFHAIVAVLLVVDLGASAAQGQDRFHPRGLGLDGGSSPRSPSASPCCSHKRKASSPRWSSSPAT